LIIWGSIRRCGRTSAADITKRAHDVRASRFADEVEAGLVQLFRRACRKKKVVSTFAWILIALVGAGALAAIALQRNERISATWFVVAAACFYLVAYRFYSAFLRRELVALDDSRATPAERNDDGRDLFPTNKWVLFGHHFAAIAGPGPLVGPTLAAQFGYLREHCG